ncbi:aminoglycoside phosphotransferase family protein [Halobacillus shinanisalinarum]|uniref:Aminoglycoside phosphotransferase family protein n=1 Tax=Halobacillus shinanisalinarum TaxID=2932258 RepID=A0ABY4H0E1_9BACI|nr:phosphotransferase [Halobacillus shinanisalinarum]UOQ93122.1 aminoglycoside phosphotransferase family protein [Halobacillus shinanisalinarum]
MKHLERRISENHWNLLNKEVINGVHAGNIIRLTIIDENNNKRKLIYKRFAADRSNEVDIYTKLLPHFESFFQIIKVWNSNPAAILMDDLGAPLKEDFDERSSENKRDLVTKVLDKLSDLHTISNLDLTALNLPKHTLSTEWLDWCCSQLDRLCALRLGWTEAGWIETVEKAYELLEVYDYEVKGPLVLTHGDPHLENTFEHNGSIFLIDWEWAALGSPLRDLTILLQDVYDSDLIHFFKELYRELLLEKGLFIDKERYRKDFNYLYIDHTAMMLAWEIEKYILGYISEKKIKEIAKFKISRIQDTIKAQKSL